MIFGTTNFLFDMTTFQARTIATENQLKQHVFKTINILASYLISVRNISLLLFVSCIKPKGNFTCGLIVGLISIKPQVAFVSRLPNLLFVVHVF